MLFLLVMEVLSTLIHKADEFSLVQSLGVSSIPHQDLHVLRDIFNVSEGASGLGCNLAKCQLVPIRCTEDQIQPALDAFPCQQAQFPIKYLGVPLSVWKIPRSSLQPMLDKVADKLPPGKGSS
jgi:hypothetical protein